MTSFEDVSTVGLRTPQTIDSQLYISNYYGIKLSQTEILFIKAFIACLTSGLGGIPIYLVGGLSEYIMGFCIIFAAGLMTGCSVVLFMEAAEICNIFYVFSYALIGVLLLYLINYFVPDFNGDINIGGAKGKNAKQALIIIFSMMLHSAGEGISVGVSNVGKNESMGLLVIISLAIHNIPEGITICILLMSRGMSISKASLFSVISNIPQPLIAIPAYLFMETFDGLLPIGFGIASGAMTYIVCTELIPEAKDKLSTSLLISSFCTSLGIIIAIALCAN